MTLKSITAALREATGDKEVELCRFRRSSRGIYFYFSGGVANRLYQQGVYVTRLHALTLTQWVRELQSRIKEL